MAQEFQFDIVQFRTRTSRVEDYQVVDIYLNGWNLIELLRNFEAPFAANEGQPSLAGMYEGLPPLMVLPPNRHFWGEPQKFYRYGRRTALLEYGLSGVPGEWPFAAEIREEPERIVWENFAQLKRLADLPPQGWDYRDFGVFRFQKEQYRQALQQAAARAY